MVFVNADEMKRSIADTGKVALYGLYFDTDKDTMRAAASSRRLISLKGSGLSRASFNLDGADFRHPRCVRGLEVKFQRFLQVRQRLLFALTLAGNIKFQALGEVPIALTPNGCSERSLHDRYSFAR